MPLKRFPYAYVQNLTKHVVHLRSFDGDSVDIPVSKNTHRIDQKFLDWQPPSPQKIRVISRHDIPKHEAIPAGENAQANTSIKIEPADVSTSAE